MGKSLIINLIKWLSQRITQHITKVRRQRYTGNKMVNQKLIRNNRRSKKFDPNIVKQKNLANRIQQKREMKAKVLAKIKDVRANARMGIKPPKKPYKIMRK